MVTTEKHGLDFSDIDLSDLNQLELEVIEISSSMGVPEGGASGNTWSCGGPGMSCSCSWNPT